MPQGVLLLEWIIAEGIIVYKAWKCGKPPMPGLLLASSGLFVILAFVAQINGQAAGFASLLGGGILIASWMNLFTKGVCGKQVAG